MVYLFWSVSKVLALQAQGHMLKPLNPCLKKKPEKWLCGWVLLKQLWGLEWSGSQMPLTVAVRNQIIFWPLQTHIHTKNDNNNNNNNLKMRQSERKQRLYSCLHIHVQISGHPSAYTCAREHREIHTLTHWHEVEMYHTVLLPTGSQLYCTSRNLVGLGICILCQLKSNAVSPSPKYWKPQL